VEVPIENRVRGSSHSGSIEEEQGVGECEATSHLSRPRRSGSQGASQSRRCTNVDQQQSLCGKEKKRGVTLSRQSKASIFSQSLQVKKEWGCSSRSLYLGILFLGILFLGILFLGILFLGILFLGILFLAYSYFCSGCSASHSLTMGASKEKNDSPFFRGVGGRGENE
jgi:hypothetical protein